MKLNFSLMVGDCRQRLKELPNESVDMVLTSPPYAWEVKYSNDKLQMGNIISTKTFFYELTKVWKLCYDKLKSGRYMAIVFADIQDAKKIYGVYMIEPLVDYMVKSMRDAGFDMVSQWIWKKYNNFFGINIRPYLSYKQISTGNYVPKSVANWEYVFVWAKPPAKPIAPDMSDEEWIESVDGIWDITYDKKIDVDLACFPLNLAKRIIKIYTKPGMTVLDPFLGSGTVMRACFELKRSCIGIEIDANRIPRIKEKCMWNSNYLDGDEAEWKIL